jgi:hypothetical protein
MNEWISIKIAIPAVNLKSRLFHVVLTLNKEKQINLYNLKIYKNGNMYWTAGYGLGGYSPCQFDFITH